PVPPPGAIASASLPGYRRAGVGAGCVDPLPPTAPPRHSPRRLQTFAWLCPQGSVSPRGREGGARKGAAGGCEPETASPGVGPPDTTGHSSLQPLPSLVGAVRVNIGRGPLALEDLDRDHAAERADWGERCGEQRVRGLVAQDREPDQQAQGDEP